MKNATRIFILVTIMLVLSGCEKKQELLHVETEKFFYKEYYQPEKKYREEEIILEEGCKEIVIQGVTETGTIHVVFENKDKKDIKYEYVVDGTLSEIIEINEQHIKDQWVLSTDINEETEGSLRLLFY